MRNSTKIACFYGLVMVLQGPGASPAEWSQWRGPERDGRAAGFPVPERWPAALAEEWKVEVGEGHSSPIVASGKVYVFARQGEEEAVLCLDLANGKRLWRSSYPAPYEMSPVATAHGKGPKATPAASEGRIYTFGIGGILSCLDASKGEVIWRKEFQGRFPRTSPLYGTAASPLIEGGLCIAHVGGHDGGALTAFDGKTGEVKWSWDGDGPGYSSPIAVDLGGERQVVTQTQAHLVGVSARTGSLLWKAPFKTPYDQNSVTVLHHQGLLFHSGVEQGTAALRVSRKDGAWSPETAWKNDEVSLYMSSPVAEKGLLLGFSHKKRGQLFSLDAASGKPLWTSDGRMGENAALIHLGSALLVLTTGGELIVLDPAAKTYRPLARYEVAKSPTWAHPAPAGDRILVKDRTSLASFKLRS